MINWRKTTLQTNSIFWDCLRFIHSLNNYLQELEDIHWFLPKILTIKEFCNLVGQDHLCNITWLYVCKANENYLISIHLSNAPKKPVEDFEKLECGRARLVTPKWRYLSHICLSFHYISQCKNLRGQSIPFETTDDQRKLQSTGLFGLQPESLCIKLGVNWFSWSLMNQSIFDFQLY